MINFSQVPAGIRVPLLYAEFNNSNAQQGPSVMPYRALILGQMTSAGSGTANQDYLVSSESQAISLFGVGSMIHRMVRKFLAANQVTALHVIAQADSGAGTAASGTLVVSGPATAAGTLMLYIAGEQVQVGVNSGDIANAIAANIQSAINAMTLLPVTATVSTNTVTVTARNKGLCGNSIDMRLNYNASTDVTPAGVAVAITALSGGAGNPTLTAAISAMGDVQYDSVACPYTDATSLSAVETEMVSRWSAIRQIEGLIFICDEDTQSNLVTFGNARNSPYVSCAGIYNSPTPPCEIAASYAAVASYYLDIDPAAPLTGLALPGVLAPKSTDRFTLTQRNVLLNNGIASLLVNAGGDVCLERTITMYQKNNVGAVDTSYLDVNTLATLSYLRYDLRTMWQTKYQRFKLADDGIRVGAGQNIITPKVAKAEVISRYRQWQDDLGLVQNIDTFKQNLVVQRNAQDPNRLDMFLPANLISQLFVTGAQFGFLLG